MCGHSCGSRNREPAAPQTRPCCQLSTKRTIYISPLEFTTISDSLLEWNNLLEKASRILEVLKLRSTSRTLSTFTRKCARPDSAYGLTPAPTTPLTTVRIIYVNTYYLKAFKILWNVRLTGVSPSSSYLTARRNQVVTDRWTTIGRVL